MLGKFIKFVKNRGFIVGAIALVAGVGFAVADSRKGKSETTETIIEVEEIIKEDSGENIESETEEEKIIIDDNFDGEE